MGKPRRRASAGLSGVSVGAEGTGPVARQIRRAAEQETPGGRLRLAAAGKEPDQGLMVIND
jgi:hypothetical protein